MGLRRGGKEGVSEKSGEKRQSLWSKSFLLKVKC